MTRNGSIWTLTAALVASRRSPTPASRAAGLRSADSGADRAGGRARRRSGQTPTPQQTGAARAGDTRPVVRADARRCGQVRARAQPRHRGPAAEPADQRHRDREHQVGLPPDADVDGRPRSRTTQRRRPDHARRGRRPGGHRRARSTYNGGIAQSIPWGGGIVHGRAEQQPADDDQQQRAVQPDVQLELVGALHAAAAARLQDRLDAPAARRSPRSTGTSPTSSCAPRSPTRCRTSATRTGTTCSPSQAVEVAQTVARPGEQAGAGQPDARRGRHDGADRRRPGAVRAGDARARRWSPPQATQAHRPSSR